MLAKSVQPFIDIFRARIFFDQNNQSYLKLRSEEKISIDIFFISIKFFCRNCSTNFHYKIRLRKRIYNLFTFSIHIFALIFWRLKSFFIFLSEFHNGLIHSERRLQTVILVVQKVLPLKPMTLDLLDGYLKKKKRENSIVLLFFVQPKIIVKVVRNWYCEGSETNNQNSQKIFLIMIAETVEHIFVYCINSVK